MAKAAKQKRETDGVSPRRKPLLRLAAVLDEMNDVYWAARQKKMSPEVMNKYIFALGQIRASIESGTLEDVQAQLAALTARAGARNASY